jgi:hypothetical protein
MSFNSNMFSQNMNSKAFVVKASVLTSALPAGGVVVTNANLPASAAVVVDSAYKRITALPATGQVKIVYCVASNKPLLETQPIDVTKITGTKRKYFAPAEQVTFIGYNGTSGDFPFLNSTSYGIYLRFEQEDQCSGGNLSFPITFAGQYETDASATNREAAFAATNSLFSSFTRVKSDITKSQPSPIRIELITNGTPTGVVPTATVTFNSKEVTLSAAVGTLAVGDTLTLGGTDTYEVAANSGTALKLTTPYRGANASAVAIAEIATATAFGMKLTAIKEDFDPVMFDNYQKVHFKVILQSGGDPVTVTETTTLPKWGIGSYEMVALEEYRSMLSQYQGTLATFIPNQAPTTFANPTSKYSIVDIKWENEVNTGLPLANDGKTFGNVRFFLELDGSSQLPNTVAGDALAETLLGTGYATGDLHA